MRAAYKFLAYAIDALILLQAAAIAWAVFGESKYIDDGNTVSKALQESDTVPFPEVAGFVIHGISGTMLIPLVGLILLIVSFFAKVEGGVKWAGLIVGDVVLQWVLGLTAFSVVALGALHAINAFVMIGLSMAAAAAATRSLARTVGPRSSAASSAASV